MTKKDYIALAVGIGLALRDKDPAARAAIWETAFSVANVLQVDNPRFDRQRFFDRIEDIGHS